jgi:hypothetical protein
MVRQNNKINNRRLNDYTRLINYSVLFNKKFDNSLNDYSEYYIRLKINAIFEAPHIIP